MSKRIFRFDDICANADMKKTIKIAEYIKSKIPSAEIIFCVSPLVHDMSSESGKISERIFPSILNAHSDYRKFYSVDMCNPKQCISPNCKSVMQTSDRQIII